MADLDGDQRASNQRFMRRGRIFGPVTNSASGEWHRIRGYYPVTICVGGTATTISWRVLVSNAPDVPTDDNHPAIGEDMDVLGIIQINAPFEWVKVVATTVAGGELFADIFAG